MCGLALLATIAQRDRAPRQIVRQYGTECALGVGKGGRRLAHSCGSITDSLQVRQLSLPENRIERGPGFQMPLRRCHPRWRVSGDINSSRERGEGPDRIARWLRGSS